MKSKLRFSIALIALGGGLALGGCASNAEVSDSAGAPAAAQGGKDQAGAAGLPQTVAGTGVDAGVSGPAAGETRYAIVTGDVTLTSDDPVATGETVTKLVGDAGGRIDAMGQSSDSYQGGPRVTLTLRVPTEKVSSVVDSLRTLGTVESVNLNSEDVTGTVVDLDARIASQELSVARVQDLLAKAATTAELLTVERELSTRQADLESMKAQRAALGDQTSLSTIDLTIQMPEDYVAPTAEDTSLGGKFLSGWRALVSTLGVIVGALALLAPWLIVAGLIALAVRWGLKRYRASAFHAKRAERQAAQSARTVGAVPGWSVAPGHDGPGMEQPVAPMPPAPPSSTPTPKN